MIHIAIHEYVNGQVVEWMEKVSEEQYSVDQNQKTVDGKSKGV